MKILVISNLFPPFWLGGYEIGCRNIAMCLAARKHEVAILTSPSHVPGQNFPNPELPLNVKVSRSLQMRALLPGHGDLHKTNPLAVFETQASNYGNTCRVLDTLADFKPDLVYLFNLYGLGGLGIIDALNFLNVPWAAHFMDRMPENLQNNIHKSVLSVFNAADGACYDNGSLIMMSRILRGEIENMCGFKFKSEPAFIPGWASCGSELISREYGVGGKYKFVSAGIVLPHKGHDLILHAAAMLKNAGIVNFTVDIFGNGDIGLYVDMAKRLHISEHIAFRGPRRQDELYEIYKSSDAFLFPTWEREPFGFAPVEAAAMGCIPVITNVCGVAERMVDQVHCLKVQRKAEALAQVMGRFCMGEIDCKRIGDNAQAITRDDLSIEKAVSRVERVLEESAKSAGRKTDIDWRAYNLAFAKHSLALKLQMAGGKDDS